MDDGHGRTHLTSNTCNVLYYHGVSCGNNEHKMGT